MSNDGTLHVSTMFGAHTRQPIVLLTYDGEGKEFEIQMSVETAREHAQAVLAVAESAVTDAFLVEFLKTKLHQPMEVVAQILGDFRVWRESKRL